MNKDDINNIRWSIKPERESIPGLILLSKDLGEALNRMRNDINSFGLRKYYERLESIEEDYRLMKDFIKTPSARKCTTACLKGCITYTAM